MEEVDLPFVITGAVLAERWTKVDWGLKLKDCAEEERRKRATAADENMEVLAILIRVCDLALACN